MKPKTIVLFGILLATSGISIYMWSSKNIELEDPSINNAILKYICKKCGGAFDMPLTDARQELRTNQGHMKCPLCGAMDQVKQDVKEEPVTIGEFPPEEPQETGTFDQDETEEETKEDPAPAPEAKPSRVKQDPNSELTPVGPRNRQ